MTGIVPQIEPRRIVHMAEGKFSLRTAKMSTGVLRYGVHDSVAVIDSTQAGKTVQEVVGFGGALPIVASLNEALRYQPEVLMLGTTPVGGGLPEEWRSMLHEALDAGLEIWSGLHQFLNDDEELATKARAKGLRIWDLRRPRPRLPVGIGRCRWAKSYVALTVGTDAALGKMTVSLEIDRLARKRGLRSEFIATGQTGIAIAGWGSPIDAIAGDFMAGAVEADVMKVDGAFDYVLVEGQGSLYHPGFSSVTLALIHGACPDGLILCHQSTRKEIANIEGIPVPPLPEVAEMYLNIAKAIKPSTLVGVAINTSGIPEEQARAELAAAERDCGVPATDVVRFGAAPLLDALEVHRKSIGK